MELAGFRFILLFTLSIFISSVSTNISDHPDEIWRRRAAEAMEATVEAYDPNPEGVANHFNMQVQNFLEGNNKGRNLLEHGNEGECMATNPIDQCWRCQNDWADNPQKLVSCVQGFGSKTTGGKGGNIYLVNDSSDHDLLNPKPGTLRHAVIQKEPLWIIFARDMNIKLSQELMMTSDKTIDGRGANVHIAHGAGITIQYVKNVIIHGIHIHHIVPASGGLIRDSVDHFGLRTSSDGDAISIFGSSNIWLDHLSMSQCHDGLIDAVQGSTAITISNCHFTKHDHVILLGASDKYMEDKMMQVTIAFNLFGEGLIQRMPRCRLGFFHVVNNDYRQWKMYAIGGSKNPTILSQGNRFIASDNKAAKEVTNRNYAPYDEWKHWIWRSEGDLFLNGAFFNQSGDGDRTKKLHFNKEEMIKAKPGTFVESLTRFSGALDCSPGKKC